MIDLKLDTHIKLKDSIEKKESRTSKQAKSDKTKEDQKLVLQATKNNDQAAFAKLLDRYRKPIYFMILQMVKNKEDAEDLTIEAFGKAFNNIEKYKPKYAFSTWIFTIATNNCIDFIRKKTIPKEPLSKSSDNGETYEVDPKSPAPDPEEEFIKTQRKALAQQIVKQLPEHYSKLVELRFFDQLTYKEISARLNMPQGTIKAQIFRAKELLYNIVKKQKNRY